MATLTAKRGQNTVKTPARQYLSNRVLKTNVGFLLSAGSGNYQDSRLDIPTPVKVADDLIVNSIDGDLRLTRSKEGILVQAHLTIQVDNECSRCLDTVTQDVALTVEELFAYPASPMSEFSVGADANLDLAPLLRAEVLIEMSHRILCRDECKGLCITCGTNLNHGICACGRDDIDPRLAVLKNLLSKE
jgi:uncharacterized protein